ncbi:hypothetical protein, partial [Niastella sp.]|uniref:hypothetical protein n=1 Tax=Niastella sp. TaxID=1869183 RepID=UPI00389A0B9C
LISLSLPLFSLPRFRSGCKCRRIINSTNSFFTFLQNIFELPPLTYSCSPIALALHTLKPWLFPGKGCPGVAPGLHCNPYIQCNPGSMVSAA